MIREPRTSFIQWEAGYFDSYDVALLRRL